MAEKVNNSGNFRAAPVMSNTTTSLRRPSKAVVVVEKAASAKKIRTTKRRPSTSAVGKKKPIWTSEASLSAAAASTRRQPQAQEQQQQQPPSLSCFGALFSVIRAATDYCRYGNLRQYLLIDPATGEPTLFPTSATSLRPPHRASGQSGNASNGSDYILPPEIRAEIVAAAKRGKLQQYLQLRRHSLQLRARSISGDSSPCKSIGFSASSRFSAGSESSTTLLSSVLPGKPGQGLIASASSSAMHAGVVSRNIQQQRIKQGSLPTANCPPLGYPYGATKPGIPKGKIPPPSSRGHVKHIKVKGKKGKKGKKETYDLIVNIDLREWQLTNEQVAEYKEVFMLFDKDEDGVLSFPELIVVMKSLGQRPSDEDLLRMVREVSADPVYDTIEFNEFLQLLSKQQRSGNNYESLNDAFSIFDKDDDGFIPVDEMRGILQSLGDKMSDQELDEMMAAADSDQDGFINYEDFVTVLCGKKRSPEGEKRQKSKKKGSKSSSKNENQIVASDEDANSNKSSVSNTSESITKLSLENNGNEVQLRPSQHDHERNDNEQNVSIVIIEQGKRRPS